MSTTSKEILAALEQVLLTAFNEKSLHAYVMTYAESLNYPHVMNFADDQWHFGVHAEKANAAGMVALAQLFRMAWDIKTYAIIGPENEEQRQIAIADISGKYCGAKVLYSTSKKLFLTSKSGLSDPLWSRHDSAAWFSVGECRDYTLRFSTISDAVWMTGIEVQEMLLSGKLPALTESRQQVADEVFQSYDFGADVEDADGWAHSTPGDEWTRSVYASAEPEAESAMRLTLTVRFYPHSADIAEAYAIDSKGQVWGEAAGPSQRLVIMAKKLGWTAVELKHAIESVDVRNDDENESVVVLANGREMRTPAHPEPCTYVRVVQKGVELAHWTDDEWADDPQGVMGAIMGCAKGPAPATPVAKQLEADESVSP